jgi:nucleoside-diphosphate-sugar epimerase
MNANNLVLIPGAGGVGRAVFEQLRSQDVPVRFMVRREDERAAEVKELGAEVVIGDLTRPEMVAAALPGVSRMLFAWPYPRTTCWRRASWPPWRRSTASWTPWSTCRS